MKTATLPNNNTTMSVPIKQEEPVIDDTYVTQSRQPSFSSAGGDDYSTETVATTVSEVDMVSSLMDQHIWPSTLQQEASMTNHHVVHPLDSALMMGSWDPNVFATDLKPQEWDTLAFTQSEQTLQPSMQQQNIMGGRDGDKNYTLTNMMPETPPVFNNTYANNAMLHMDNFGLFQGANGFHHSAPPTAISTPNSSGLITPPVTNYFQGRSSLPTPPSKKMLYMSNNILDMNRRSSSTDTRHIHQRFGKRASSNPSVASVVSLTAHEPVSKIIDGVEYITFLYSHDRLVKEYTVRTDVDNVNMDDIVMDFRIQNAIYPRANVDRSEYDGNRWDYETTCNQLGWKLCWLNKEQLFGRRGLIQRAVDSYRNRHAEMRSRRVTRQEKVANGTLRKRRSKKSLTHNIL